MAFPLSDPFDEFIPPGYLSVGSAALLLLARELDDMMYRGEEKDESIESNGEPSGELKHDEPSDEPKDEPSEELKVEPREFRLETSLISASQFGIIFIRTEQGSFHIRPPVSYLRDEYLRLIDRTYKNLGRALVLSNIEPVLYQFRRDLAAGHLQAEVLNATDGRPHKIPAYFWNSDSGEKVLWNDFPACFEVDDQSFGGRAVISLAEAERFFTDGGRRPFLERKRPNWQRADVSASSIMRPTPAPK